MSSGWTRCRIVCPHGGPTLGSRSVVVYRARLGVETSSSDAGVADLEPSIAPALVARPTPPPLSTALFWPITTVGSKRTLSLSACLGVAGCSTTDARSDRPPGLGEAGLYQSSLSLFAGELLAGYRPRYIALPIFLRAVQRQFRRGRNCNPICKFGSFVQDRFATILALTPLDRRWSCPSPSPIVIGRDVVPRFLK